MPLLDQIPCLEGSVITADSMQCQQNACAYLTQQRGADYVIGLKGNQAGIFERAQLKLPQAFFAPQYDSGWEKGHGRLQRWQVQTKQVTPEQSGLTGCCQLVSVFRERQYLRAGKVYKEEQEYAYYVTSLHENQSSAKEIASIIRGHWGAVENGAHHRRDASMGEDKSRIAQHNQAHMMASLRNLALALYEKDKQHKEFKDSLPSWQRKMTFKKAFQLLNNKK